MSLSSHLTRPCVGRKASSLLVGAAVLIMVGALSGVGAGAASATPVSSCPTGTPLTGGVPLGGPSSVAVATQTVTSTTSLLGPDGTVVHSLLMNATGTTAVGAYQEMIVDHYASQDLCVQLSSNYSAGPTGLLQKFPYYLSVDVPGATPSGLGHHYVHGLMVGLNPSAHLPSYVTRTWTILVTQTGTTVLNP